MNVKRLGFAALMALAVGVSAQAVPNKLIDLDAADAAIWGNGGKVESWAKTSPISPSSQASPA